jgi:uncharacterized protein YdaU (DUF1376 family)
MTTGLYWFKTYHAEEIASTLLLSLKARGAYFGLMLHYFREGSLPKNDHQLRKIAGAEAREWKTIHEELKAIFTSDWRHERWDGQIKAEEKTRQQRSRAGQASAAVRAGRGDEGYPPSYDTDADIPF